MLLALESSCDETSVAVIHDGRVLANVVSFEGSDASIVERIAAGEADAAIVYRSDLSSTAAADLRAVTIPAEIGRAHV